MLVLSRKKNESIMIGDQIEIKIVAIEGELVRLGIDAPRSVQVHRKEVYEQIKEENQRATQRKMDWAAVKQWIPVEKQQSDER
ncbi:carbon storage regulator CsrA [Brevibacillus sp. SYP-B805]|uniref:carbon storage regulator CsrA n=1 Tax=Brevibacillus sp. SYP-B805 TaxID=1578199 RepID=UPI0013EA7405|nr:carbon storage regulator CsrA [Brevibacillus sp. SYP-B805]NGQ95633.1 carbon storage regulator CsrA [Brevibacillus sp. SYP-B805]